MEVRAGPDKLDQADEDPEADRCQHDPPDALGGEPGNRWHSDSKAYDDEVHRGKSDGSLRTTKAGANAPAFANF
jgi:hypothetical protein